MSSNSTPLIQEWRADFEKVLHMGTSPEAATATLLYTNSRFGSSRM